MASRAVQGDVNQIDDDYCAHPEAPSGNSAWWQVDLGDVYVINNITIVNGREGGGKCGVCVYTYKYNRWNIYF